MIATIFIIFSDVESEAEDDEDWSPFIPEKPSPILYGCYGNETGKFWLSMVRVFFIDLGDILIETKWNVLIYNSKHDSHACGINIKLRSCSWKED